MFWGKGKKKASQSLRVTQFPNPKGYRLSVSQPRPGSALGMVKQGPLLPVTGREEESC